MLILAAAISTIMSVYIRQKIRFLFQNFVAQGVRVIHERVLCANKNGM